MGIEHRIVQSGVAILLGALVCCPGTVWAEPQACISLHADGQREAKAGKLLRATELYMACISDFSCPGMLRKECDELLSAVQANTPTAIFSVVDKTGKDISTVKIYVDDVLVAEVIDGRAISLDPGKHRFQFTLPDGTSLTSELLIREGDKRRLIQVQQEKEELPVVPPEAKVAPAPAKESPVVPPVASPPVPPTKKEALPTTFWVATAGALVGLGVGTGFAIGGSGLKSELSNCGPYCSEAERGTYSNLKRDYLIADIGFAVGAVSAGVAIWKWVAWQSGQRTPAVGSAPVPGLGRRLVPSVSMTRQGASFSWTSTF